MMDVGWERCVMYDEARERGLWDGFMWVGGVSCGVI